MPWKRGHWSASGVVSIVVVVVIVVVIEKPKTWNNILDYDNDNRFADNDNEKRVPPDPATGLGGVKALTSLPSSPYTAWFKGRGDASRAIDRNSCNGIKLIQ